MTMCIAFIIYFISKKKKKKLIQGFGFCSKFLVRDTFSCRSIHGSYHTILHELQYDRKYILEVYRNDTQKFPLLC